MGVCHACLEELSWTFNLHRKEHSPIKDYFFDSAYDLFNMNGANSVPINANLTCIVYNKDMFDAEGLPYPDETWTWDDIQAALK